MQSRRVLRAQCAWASPPNACSPQEGKEEGRKQSRVWPQSISNKDRSRGPPVQPCCHVTHFPTVSITIYLSPALNCWQEAEVSVWLYLTLDEMQCQRLCLGQCNRSFKQDGWSKLDDVWKVSLMKSRACGNLLFWFLRNFIHSLTWVLSRTFMSVKWLMKNKACGNFFCLGFWVFRLEGILIPGFFFFFWAF